MSARGQFITVEGIEGVGKSTNMAFLAERIREAGIPVVVTREPGGTALAEDIRQLLVTPRQESMDSLAELLLIFAARAQHLGERVRPSLERGSWVLCDRFTDATYAYQGSGRGLPAQWIATLEQMVQGELRPDCTILLDAPVALGAERAGRRSEPDRFERERAEFFERVRHGYLQMSREFSKRYRLVDASQPLEEVQRQLCAIIDPLLARSGRPSS